MERRALNNRWQPVQWVPVAVDPEAGAPGAPQILDAEPTRTRWLYPGLETDLYADEAEGYFLNFTTARPVIFVAWRMEGERAVPWMITASYNEASRLMDNGESVDPVDMPHDMACEISAYVSAHYKPNSKRRIRPPSFNGARRDG